jgi:UDP-glucose 6-dehydrogenase
MPAPLDFYPPAVIGMGRLGSAFNKAVLFRLGISLACVDNDPSKGHMSLAEFARDHVPACKLVYVCVPAGKGTPNNRPGSFYDRTYLREVITTLGEAGFDGEMVIRTTISPWDVKELAVAANRYAFTFHTMPVLSDREDLSMDMLQPRAVAIGLDPRLAVERIREAFEQGDTTSLETLAVRVLCLIYPDYRIMVTDASTAMMIKLSQDGWWEAKSKFIHSIVRTWKAFCPDKGAAAAVLAGFLDHPDIGRKFVQEAFEEEPLPGPIALNAEAFEHLQVTAAVRKGTNE